MAQANPPAGSIKRQVDEVKHLAIFRESVKKEMKHRSVNENFDFNPKNLIAITDKPTRKFDMGDGSNKDEVLQEKLSTLSKMPKQKFSYPMTAAQEIGWDMDTEYKHHVPKEAKNKNMCPETKYADNFVTF